jgi:hypothetical protein
MADPYKRDRRLGRWFLSGREMREYPGRLEDIQRHVVILRAEPGCMSDRIEFMGRSPDFDIVEEGSKIPLYCPVVVADGVKWMPMSGFDG